MGGGQDRTGSWVTGSRWTWWSSPAAASGQDGSRACSSRAFLWGCLRVAGLDGVTVSGQALPLPRRALCPAQAVSTGLRRNHGGYSSECPGRPVQTGAVLFRATVLAVGFQLVCYEKRESRPWASSWDFKFCSPPASTPRTPEPAKLALSCTGTEASFTPQRWAALSLLTQKKLLLPVTSGLSSWAVSRLSRSERSLLGL